MRSLFISLVVTFIIFTATTFLSAETSMGAGNRDALVEQDDIQRLSIGMDFLRIKRDIKYKDGDTDIARADSYSVYLGVDLFRWLNIFAAGGTVSLAENESDVLDSDGTKWSLGINLRLWRLDITDPSFLRGECSIEAIADYSQYEISDSGDLLKLNETFSALLFGYEIFSDDMKSIESYPYSLRLFAGPAFCDWDGKFRIWGDSKKFKNDSEGGLAAGADVYLSHNLLLGCHLHYFGESTINAMLRYHF